MSQKMCNLLFLLPNFHLGHSGGFRPRQPTDCVKLRPGRKHLFAPKPGAKKQAGRQKSSVSVNRTLINDHCFMCWITASANKKPPQSGPRPRGGFSGMVGEEEAERRLTIPWPAPISSSKLRSCFGNLSKVSWTNLQKFWARERLKPS